MRNSEGTEVVKKKGKPMFTNISHITAGTGTVGAPLISHAPVFVDIAFAPPKPREEAISAPPSGYVWSPGFWNWSGHKHDWVAGRHIRERQGHHWVPDHWEQRGSRWRFEAGRWE